MQSTIHFDSLRADWFANGTFMSRALQRQLRSSVPLSKFCGFPRQWVPLFEWAEAPWSDSIEPSRYVPLISNRSEGDILAEVRRARSSGELRLLVEVIASGETILCETLQRIDAGLEPTLGGSGQVRLTSWHGYSRPEVRAFDSELAGFVQTKPSVLFIPCTKGRPYYKSPSHRRLLASLRAVGLKLDELDVIVITSIGPVPQPLWDHNFVQRYDTGIRDIYRILIQLRSLLYGTRYEEAWDLMPFAPYSDLLSIAHKEGLLPPLQRISGARRRNIPAYRAPKRATA